MKLTFPLTKKKQEINFVWPKLWLARALDSTDFILTVRKVGADQKFHKLKFVEKKIDPQTMEHNHSPQGYIVDSRSYLDVQLVPIMQKIEHVN